MKYNVQNNVKLIEKIEKIDINEYTKLVSIDFKDMFTSIEVGNVLKLIENNRLSNYKYKKQLIKIVKESVQQNYFRLNNRFYIQEKGLPVGSSLSPILAEIYMNDFEKKSDEFDKV